MGFGGIGVSGFILILIVALLIFGPSKLPEIGKAFGKTLKEFKNAASGLVDDEDNHAKKQQNLSESEKTSDNGKEK
ncbi:MAG: twin-arginine translocase TatA/TatE family subunit [Sporolactobacillus sp.]|jgi:sec-independent protein translocase protein TatA|nr:twin-arginine translocase TatA/TatE family subunit [Sporolactobacillus sp.]